VKLALSIDPQETPASLEFPVLPSPANVFGRPRSTTLDACTWAAYGWTINRGRAKGEVRQLIIPSLFGFAGLGNSTLGWFYRFECAVWLFLLLGFQSSQTPTVIKRLISYCDRRWFKETPGW